MKRNRKFLGRDSDDEKPEANEEAGDEDSTRYREMAADGAAALADGLAGLINTVVGWCRVIYQFVPFLSVYFPETDLSPVHLIEGIAMTVAGPVDWLGNLAKDYGESLDEEQATAATPEPDSSSGGYVNIENSIDRTCEEKVTNVAPFKGSIAERLAMWAMARVEEFAKLKYAALVAFLWGATAKQLDFVWKALAGTVFVETVILNILQCFNFQGTSTMSFFGDVMSRCQVGITDFFMSIFWG